MKTLDRYIVRTFLTTVGLFLLAMMMLRIVMHLFVKMDEFTEDVESLSQVFSAAWLYYVDRSLVYFIELGGVIIVASATFSLARMNHTNELTAMLASGVSLHRIVWPIIVCSMLLGGLIILDQELLVPRVAHRLIRQPDEYGGRMETEFMVPALTDSSNTAWYSARFSTLTGTMSYPLALIRNESFLSLGRVRGTRAEYGRLDGVAGWDIHGADLVKITEPGGVVWPANPSGERVPTDLRLTPLKLLTHKNSGQDRTGNVPLVDLRGIYDRQFGLTLYADRFVPDPYVPQSRRTGRLENPRFVFSSDNGHPLGTVHAAWATWEYSDEVPGSPGFWRLSEGLLFLPSDLTPGDLTLRRATKWISYMSSADLMRLLRINRIPDERTAVLTLHIRVANPINNLIMLLLGLPFILSRLRNIKASAFLCLAVVGAFYMFVYFCRYLDIPPVWSAWLPTLVFGPVAVVMLDSIKT